MDYLASLGRIPGALRIGLILVHEMLVLAEPREIPALTSTAVCPRLTCCITATRGESSRWVGCRAEREDPCRDPSIFQFLI